MTHASRTPRLVAWRSPSDLLILKNSFFPPPPSSSASSPDHDPRLDALKLTQALSIRTRLPHSIESTSLLTSAILSDTPTTTPLTTRLTYATAIIRFVNGLVDPAQQGQFALPMHQIAKDLGLDASFVEIRHAATHEELPSLQVLRRMAGRALEWLWWHYWCAIDNKDVEAGGEVAEEEVMLEKARVLVRRWRMVRKEAPGRELKDGDQSEGAKDARAVVKELVEIGKRNEGLEAVVGALLEVKALVPKGKKKEKLMGGAVVLWAELLRRLETGLEGFIEALVGAILDVWREAGEVGLRQGEKNVEVDGEYNAALAFWVKYFAAGELMKDRTPAVDVHELAKECVLAPNKWSMQLLHYLSTAHPAIANSYGKLAGLVEKPVETSSNRSHLTLEDMDGEISQYEEGLRRVQQIAVGLPAPMVVAPLVADSGRWKRWEGPWLDRPLGVVV
ncbi:Las1-domain-containing protein [Ascodesmis nigricans]|uniref:Las1-domain-containing protein n=1 Tax=Ascodesmis nigricans TaxID=341454 RepID=A0A4S2N1R9_9PEZI|nr:Las1-domain-containing protein [Ascodesmis nigricans]